MPFQVVTITQPTPNGAYVQSLTDSVVISDGSADAGQVVVTGSDGLIDSSLLPSGSGGGSVGLPIPATEVSYDNVTYPTVEAALNHLLFVSLSIEEFTSNEAATHEIGTTVSGVQFSWAYNKAVVSQSINQGVGSLDPSLRTVTVNFAAPGLTTSETWTLTASDGTSSSSATTSVNFLPQVYWGVSPNTELTNAEVLALGSSAFASSIGRSIAYNATGGNYPFYAYPSNFGDPTSVVVGGLVMSAYTITVQSVTNASGYTQSYNVIRFNNIQTGSNIQTVWA